ncbi:MAG: hypothetical protein E7241_11125 [Lachnospiraceae bacterium]|nr:hypothetical protein [Lachnospiraceae bacterium]
MITFTIDDVVPCLKEVLTGELYDTEVVRIRRKSILEKYNKRTGWYVNWSKFPQGTEVYALVLKGTNDVQGLIAVDYDDEASAIHVVWGCTAPHNNIWQYGKQKFSGVGGHLLAIAAELSVRHGYDGFIYGEAADKELFDYYCDRFGALYLPPIDNPYRFMLSDVATARLREVYSYEWTDDVI